MGVKMAIVMRQHQGELIREAVCLQQAECWLSERFILLLRKRELGELQRGVLYMTVCGVMFVYARLSLIGAGRTRRTRNIIN
jgi:hypothetical protein